MGWIILQETDSRSSINPCCGMRTLSALMFLCEGNPPVNGGFPTQRSVMRTLTFSLFSACIGCWANSPFTGDLRRHYAHVMSLQRCTLTAQHRRQRSSYSSSVCATVLIGAIALQWRHNGRDSVSNHLPHDCLLNRLFRRRSKKTSKLRVTGLCAGNSPGPVNSPHKWPVTRKIFPFDDVIMGLLNLVGCLITFFHVIWLHLWHQTTCIVKHNTVKFSVR